MIGIIAAMDKEIAILRDSMQIEKTLAMAGRTFYVGRLDTTSCVLVRSGIGKVNAAVTATLLLEKLGPDMLINTGVAGGLPPMAIGDIALAEGIAYFDVNLQGIDDIPYGQMPGSPLIRPTDRKLTAKTEHILQNAGAMFRKGVLLSGDTFVSDPGQLEDIRGVIDDAIAVEMEGMAVAEACAAYDVPFVSLRGISDMIGGTPGESYAINVADVCRTTTDVVMHWLANIDG